MKPWSWDKQLGVALPLNCAATQNVNELQNAAGFGFQDGFHHQLPALIQDGDHNRLLVHVHADILDVATHRSCLLGGKIIRANACLSL
jgi:hypothetical protein